MRFIAKLISYLFHPIWMPLYVIFILWSLNTEIHLYNNLSTWLYIILVICINSIIIPILMFYMMKKLGIIQSFAMEDRKDRLYPFLITGVFYITTWFVFHNLQILELIAYIFIVASILVFLALFINIFWKISIHTMSMGALSVFVLWLTAVNLITSPWPAYLIIILSGLVGFSRLKLKSHNSTQVYVGYLTGVIVLASVLLGLG